MDINLLFSVILYGVLVLFSLCETRQNKFFIPKHQCNIGTLCNSTLNYPEREIKQLLMKYKKMFPQLSSSVIEPAEYNLFPQVRSLGPPYEEVNTCKTKKVNVLPKTGFDINMKLKYIVNVDDFPQSLTYETCLNSNVDCFGKDIFPNDFNTFCKQTYNVVKLLAINHAGRLEYGRFTVPSCCVCSYRRDNRFT